MKASSNRPLSPHLSIWRWGPGMAVSIMHRATGVGMATVGVTLLVWWLVAAAGGEAPYAAFTGLLTVESGKLNALGYLLLAPLSLAFFQHLCSGIRHLVLDLGAGYELKANKLSAVLTWPVALLLTALFWFAMLAKGA